MGEGPIGSDINCPISDPGTSVRGPSPSRGSACLETDPNNQAQVQQLQENVNYLEERASAAKAEMQSYLHSLPPEEKKLAQEDLHRLDLIEITTENLFSHLLDGSSRDPREFGRALNMFGKFLVAVEAGNERYKTARVFGTTEFALELVTVIVRGTERIEKAANALPDDIKDLQKQLDRAKKDVKGADRQMAINGVLFVVTKLLEGAFPPLGAIEIFLRAGAFTVAVMENDRLHGPNSSPWADLDVAAGSLIEKLPHGVTALSESTKELFGKVSALGTLAFDVHEILEAKEIVEKLKKKGEQVARELESIEGWLRTNLPKLPGLRKAIVALNQAGASAGVDAAAANQIYREHKSAMGQPEY